MKTAKEWLLEQLKEFPNHDEYDPKAVDAIADFMEHYAKYYHQQQVKSVDLADVVCSSCGSSNKKWDRYEITLNDKDGTDVDVSVDYCEDCGHVFKMNEY